MKYQEIKERSEAELQKLVKANREKLRDLRFKVANKQLKDIREVRRVKAIISRSLTVLSQKRSSAKVVAPKQ